MNTFTHLGISQRLRYAVEKEFNIKLDSAGFIKEEINNLLNLKLNKCTRFFSERLGIITHYLSDFFCHAHSEYFRYVNAV